MNKQQGNIAPRTAFGLGVIIFAALLFLSNIGLPFLGVVLKNWPLLMIIAGIILLKRGKDAQPTSSRNQYLPHVLIGLGAVFQLASMHILNLSVGAILVPIGLLFLGIHLIRPRTIKGDKQHGNDSSTSGESSIIDGELEYGESSHFSDAIDAESTEEGFDDTKIDVFTILGGGNFSTRSTRLQGGSVTAIFGGVEIDIREADTQQSVIEIDVIALMSGIEIKVPAHFSVTVKVFPLLGGVTNKTTCLAEKIGIPKRNLIITGVALMGGIDIHN